MKKIIKKLIVLVCCVMLVLVPATSASAASNLTLVDRTADSVSYYYQPDPFYLKAGDGVILINDYVADDLFHVDPWTEFTFSFSLKY